MLWLLFVQLRLRASVPLEIIPEEDSFDSRCAQFLRRRIKVREELISRDAFHANHVFNAKSEKASEFFEPAPVKSIRHARRFRTSIFKLGIFPPHNERYLHLHREPDWHGKNAYMVWPKLISYPLE